MAGALTGSIYDGELFIIIDFVLPFVIFPGAEQLEVGKLVDVHQNVVVGVFAELEASEAGRRREVKIIVCYLNHICLLIRRLRVRRRRFVLRLRNLYGNLS